MFPSKNISGCKIICIFARYIYVYEENEDNIQRCGGGVCGTDDGGVQQ